MTRRGGTSDEQKRATGDGRVMSDDEQGLVIQDWDKAQADWLTIRSTQPAQDAEPEEATPSWVNS